MAPFLGFVLVTHTEPEQIAFLCWKLHAMFDGPPIAIHHDYSKCHLEKATLPPQVQIVDRWIQTAWGAFNLVDAYLLALRLLHAEHAPEWTINLSAADYPVKSAPEILSGLRSASADAFLDFREISKNGTEPSDAESCATTYKQRAFMLKAHERYLSFSTVHYHIRRLVGRADRAFYVSGDWMTRLLTPFSDSLRLYAGDWWHTVNRRAATVLLAEDPVSLKLRRYLRNRPVPDETYVHCVLLNRPELKVVNNNRRYTSWSPGAYHPRLLDFGDIPDLIASNAYFARKFPFNTVLYEAVDRAVQGAIAVQ